MSGRREQFQAGPFVTAQTVRVGDVVHARGGWRTVRDLRAYSGGDRLLVFEGRITYRLIVNATLRVTVPVGPGSPAPAPVVWRAEPDPRPETGRPMHFMQCAACRQQSPPASSPETVREWVTAHAGLHPAHRLYRQITTRPWHATPTQDTP